MEIFGLTITAKAPKSEIVILIRYPLNKEPSCLFNQPAGYDNICDNTYPYDNRPLLAVSR